MTPAQRREGRIGLTMLPVGLALVIAAVIGIVAVAALAVTQLVAGDDDWGWYVGWAAFAFAGGVRNLLKSLESMSGLDVRGTLVTLAWSAAIVVAYPGWWLA
jgi:hypothetical protein